MPNIRNRRQSFLKNSLAIIVVAVVAGACLATAATSGDRLRVNQMGGDIDYADVPDGGDFKTMGGNVHLGKAHNDITITTMGGDISVGSADGSVKATTMGGNISIDSADSSVEAKTMGGSIEVMLVKGDSSAAHTITLSSMSGQIILTVPKDYPMTVDVELAYTKSNEGKYKITESLGLEHGVSKDWSSWEGSPRKKLYAKGKVGNGQNHVTIKTINGDVIIKGERSQL